jgi:alkane 1-monooxygenase
MNLLKKLGFFSAFTIPMFVIVGYYLGGWWNFSCIIFTYGMLPIADWLIGRDAENNDESVVSELSEERFYRFVTYGWVYVQLVVVVWGAYTFAYGNIGAWYFKLAFLMGIANATGGVGITVAHELGHKSTKIEQFYAKVLLMTVSYMHFFIEHNKGHHVWVSTPQDPATSRKGENFYHFFFRSVIKGFKSALSIENERLKRKSISVWSFQNEMILFVILPILFCAVLTIGLYFYTEIFSWNVAVFFFAQSILAFSLLEAVNYIEHYGIMRNEIGNGRYERVNPTHSWNSNYLVTNFYLFQLQRHSDHHANASRRYQVLRHFEESPQMPQGYPAMMLMAMIPPLWFKVMDNRLESWQMGQAVVN